MWYWSEGPGWAGWLLMSLVMVAFWALVVWSVVYFVRWSRAGGEARRPRGETSRETPEETLARRFANGEIDEEEYRRRLDTLRMSGPLSRRGG